LRSSTAPHAPLERFEEVIARHLSEFDLVIAVSPAGLDRPPIGAARMNMDGSQWQKKVGEIGSVGQF
jgi:hypothetical protein